MNWPVKVFLVDDSAFMRRLLTAMLEQDGNIKVVGYARNGYEALEKIPVLKPHVVTMDVEMPEMDGLETLSMLMVQHPVSVIMVSALTTEGAYATLKALELGALDFVAKPSRQGDMPLLAAELRSKVMAIAGVSLGRVVRSKETARATASQQEKRLYPAKASVDLVAIGTSTGGPSALRTIISALPADFPAGVLIAQHMPPGFTKPLAQRLNELSSLRVKEAEEGDIVRPGTALVAPAGWQTMLAGSCGRLEVRLAKEAPFSTLFKPSVDVMFLSAAEACGQHTLGVILTGMGSDGVRGMKEIKEKGGRTLAEAETSCIVYGMPKAAIEAGVVDGVYPLASMAAEIIRQVNN
ncbi:MAG: protein-glutamate methylesterase/protein-glutamine glutaminase [Bacillota bacterium]